MRVLTVHNFYRSSLASGENLVVAEEATQLADSGIIVQHLTRHSDSALAMRGIKAASMAIKPIYAPDAVREVRRRIGRDRPDVIHVHNVYPLISPSIIRAARRCGVPVVQTIHNYRHSCVNGLHFRAGSGCFDCMKSVMGIPAVQHGCYQASRLRTIPMVTSQLVHRSTWAGISAFFVLTPFMLNHAISAGLPGDRLHLRATSVEDPGPVPPPAPSAPLLYVGRLQAAKGVDLLAEAMLGGSVPRRLLVAGSGPSRTALEEAISCRAPITLLGEVAPAAVSRLLRECSALVMPSLCVEGYPRVIAEAFAHGRPVVTLKGGSAESIVDDRVGWTSGREAGSLRETLRGITDGEARARGIDARLRYERDCSRKASIAQLLDVYDAVIAEGAAR
jgi:glycosyltransferase involved in cell wall biosynthesis